MTSEGCIVAATEQLIVNDELARETTKKLARSLESAALLIQSAVLIFSTNVDVDKTSGWGRGILYTLTCAHVLAAVIVRKEDGPFSRGGIWLGVWASMLVIMPLVVAHLVRPASYGSGRGGVPLFGYPLGPLLLFAFYPWVKPRWAKLKLALEIGILAIIAVEPLLIIFRMRGGHLDTTNYISVAVSAGWNVTAYVLGKAIGQMCRTAVASQLNMQQQNYHEFFNLLHSHVDTAISQIKNQAEDRESVLQELDRLQLVLSSQRLEMLLVCEPVLLANIIRENMRFFGDDLIVSYNPRACGLTVSRPIAVLISRALGDLFKNTVQHAGGVAQLDFTIKRNVVFLDVVDGGPDFPSSILDDPSTSLFRLRCAARALDGDLIKLSTPGPGAHLQLFVPLFAP